MIWVNDGQVNDSQINDRKMIRVCAGNPEQIGCWLQQYRHQRPLFACVLSFTETGRLPDISAAGITSQARDYTALADGEILIQGHTQYPRPPLQGGISPAIIARSLLTRQNIPIHLLSTGLPHRLTAPHIELPQVIAKAVPTGRAMSPTEVMALLESGLYWGQALARRCLGSYFVVGECVVGGTTTAQAVLTALGYDIAGCMSSSHPMGNHHQKQAIVSEGLAQWRWHSPSRGRSYLNQSHQSSALSAVAAVGDPMQVVVAGMLLAASRTVGVLLAGGSQMLAVYALARAIAQQQNIPWETHRVLVGTTRWVVEDRYADVGAIAQAIEAPCIASTLSFRESPYVQLRAYEQGYVKEGVGAGGCVIAAHLYKDWNNSQIRHAVEAELRRCL